VEDFMSQLTYELDYSRRQMPEAVAQGLEWYEPKARSRYQWCLLLLPVCCGLLGFFVDSPAMTDLGFFFLTILCAAFLISELINFGERFGVGGIVLFGGVLIWFCYDYMTRWFLLWTKSWDLPIDRSTVARSAMCHMIYVCAMTFGLQMTSGKWFNRLLLKLPDLPDPRDYFWIVVLTQVIGFAPFFIWTSEPFYLAIYHQFFAGRTGGGAAWTVGRTGNVNYNYGAYVAQILQIGGAGAILATFCIALIRQSTVRNVLCFFFWVMWLTMGFGSGTRGEIVYYVLPLVVFLFLRFHGNVGSVMKHTAIKAYGAVVALIFFAIVAVQVQIHYRNFGFGDINLSDVDVVHLEGNTMFSEGLMGFSYIPARHDFFYSTFPGETLILPIPNFLFWAAIAPMPRAFWTNKPIDPSWRWYNDVFSGGSGDAGGKIEGTTIAQGIVGYWYFRFGVIGVIEGGLFMGWLMGRAERSMLNHAGKPIVVFAAMGILIWIFRAFRDIGLQDLTQVLVGLAGVCLCILAIRPFVGSAAPGEQVHQA
jgi:hypothetical protein